MRARALLGAMFALACACSGISDAADAGASADAARLDAAADADGTRSDARTEDAAGDDAGLLATGTRIALPPAGGLYHGVYPGGSNGWEGDITLAHLADYETAAGRPAAWVYFSNNWFESREFPLAIATFVRAHGALPFIRLMLRSNVDSVTGADPTFPLAGIAAGAFDADLDAWGAAAAEFGTPLVVEWGTEMNGDWFSWNGTWNGGPSVGPARFVEVYRHIVDRLRAAGASNVAFAFHVDGDDSPAEPWNAFENYYPGDAYVDWLGVSAYGPQSPTDRAAPSLRETLDVAVPRLVALSPTRPVFLFELGCAAGSTAVSAPEWADAALSDLLAARWPALRGFAWWNETWENDGNPAHDTDMRVESVPGLSAVFQSHLVGSAAVLDRPVFR